MILLSCREVSRMMARGEFEEISGPAKFLARLHLLYCRHCRRYRRQLKLIAQAARLWAETLVASPRQEDFEEKLIERLSGS